MSSIACAFKSVVRLCSHRYLPCEGHFANKAMSRPGGNPDFHRIRNTDTRAANLARQQAADAQALKVFDLVCDAINDGCTDLSQCMQWLNAHGHFTRGNSPKPWSGKTFKRVLGRLAKRRLLSQQDARRLLGLRR